MIIIHDNSTINQIINPAIRELVLARINDLGGVTFDTDELGYLLVVESSDTLEAWSVQLGFDLPRNRFTGIRYDQADFTPSFEFIKEFPSCFDIVFVLSDDSMGVELFVPKEAGIDPDLIGMCRMYSNKAPLEDAP